MMRAQTHATSAQARRPTVWGLITGVALLVAACGPHRRVESPARDVTAPAVIRVGRPTPPATVSTVGKALEDPYAAVGRATVRITGDGTFVDPDMGEVEGTGVGSGFIIDPSGLAVTANHVVAGAGMLLVDVPGEDEPRNARVVATAECSDLALIDIDGDGFPTVSWADEEPDPADPVIAVGYPLGEEEQVMTSGIVGTTDANGETPWSSVDTVIEHDASIQPGNSGGPLVDRRGDVIGVNFAGDTSNWTERFFAIGRREVTQVLDELKRGHDVDSVGINGSILEVEWAGTGLWVAGVTSGSSADIVGLEPGDLVTSIEGVSVGADWTMSSYCDVLRSHRPSDVLTIVVWRSRTSERLVGQLNGKELEVTDDQLVTGSDGDGAIPVPWS